MRCDAVRMTKTNEDLIRRIEGLVAEHIASTRQAVQETIERAFAGAVEVKACNKMVHLRDRPRGCTRASCSGVNGYDERNRVTELAAAKSAGEPGAVSQ